MTQKELSYIEDAIGHENNIISICNESIKILENDELINFLKNEVNEHTDTLNRLINMLEVKANE